MPFQQATQAQDADPLGNALDAGQAYEPPVQRGLEQGFWHGRLGQAKPLPNEVDAQHGFEFKRRTPCLGSRCVRRNQREQSRARRREILLVQQHRLACAPLVQVQAKVLLLHGHIVRRSGTVHWSRATEF